VEGEREVTRGICYVAYGDKALNECAQSLETLRWYHKKLPVTVISDKSHALHADYKHAQSVDAGGRWAKLNLDTWSPYDETLYIDADTRIRERLDVLFQSLEDGYEFVIVPSNNQSAGNLLWHVSEGERETTYDEVGYTPLQLQGGVFAFRKTDAVLALFEAWREEWERYKDQDQGALLRAIHRVPVRYRLLGRPFNGTTVIQHLFGRCR